MEAGRLPVAAGGIEGLDAWLHLPAPGAPAAGPPRRPVLLLPGAAGDAGHAGLVAHAEAFASGGHPVVRAMWPHRQRGRGGAPRAEASIAPLARILDGARGWLAKRLGDDVRGDWVLGGRSYGGRVASMLVAERGGDALGVERLLCVAYPLVPPARRDGTRPPSRSAHWTRIDVPTCFVVGTRDHFWDEAVFAASRGSLSVPVEVVRLDGGDHELRVRARDRADGRGLDPAAGARATADAVLAWLAEA